MKLCEYWRSRSFLYHIFSRFCLFCALLGQDIRWAFTGPLVLWFVIVWALLWENRSSGFLTWSNTNRAVQSQMMSRGLKFQIYEVEGLYYLCSENKDADQLGGYREADLRLCFRICKKPVFSWRGSFVSIRWATEWQNYHNYQCSWQQLSCPGPEVKNPSFMLNSAELEIENAHIYRKSQSQWKFQVLIR